MKLKKQFEKLKALAVAVLMLVQCASPALAFDPVLFTEPASPPSVTIPDENGLEEEMTSSENPHTDFLASSPLQNAETQNEQAAKIVINGGALYTSKRNVQLEIQAPEGFAAVEMSFAVNSTKPGDFSAWETFDSSKSLRIPGFEGANYVNVRLRDAEGKERFLWDSIILDRTPPTGYFVIENARERTHSRDVTVLFNVQDASSGIAEMSYAFDSWNPQDFSPWEDFSFEKNIRLPRGEGKKTVNIRIRDLAGNIRYMSSSIIYDAPLYLKLDQSEEATNKQDIELLIEAPGFEGTLLKMRYSINDRRENAYTQWEDFQSSRNIRLPAYEGNNYVNVQLQDSEGTVYYLWDSILFDRTPPAGNVVINGGAQYAQDIRTELVFDMTDTGSGLGEFSFSWNSTDPASFSPWESFSAQKIIAMPDHKGFNYLNIRVRDRAGNVRYLWQPVFYHPDYATMGDYLIAVNMNYFDPAFGLIETTHEYPGEGFGFMEYTQPSNLGFYAEFLASIAAGDLTSPFVTPQQALSKITVLIDHLLEDQASLGYKGLLPWFLYDGSDWKRRSNDIYGRQVSFEDNSNLTLSLGLAYGALLDQKLAGHEAVHGGAEEGVLSKIDRFIETQREGYACLYDENRSEFRRTMAIDDSVTTCGENASVTPVFSGGYVDFFGAESRSPALFLALIYGDDIPERVYTDLMFSAKNYTFSTGETLTVASPFQGAFQMLWPALFMPESENADLRQMLENYTDVLLDYTRRNNLPGFLSSSYDVRPAGNLLYGADNLMTFAGASGAWNQDGWHITAASHDTSATAFIQENLDLTGHTLKMRYQSGSEIASAVLEFKKELNGTPVVIETLPLNLENTNGAEKELLISLAGLNADLSDIDEIVLLTRGTGTPLDLTLTEFGAIAQVYRSFYNGAVGIPEIALSGDPLSLVTTSLYTLGPAAMFRPQEVDNLLVDIIRRWPGLISEHGLWEGVNTAYNRIINKQIFPNVVTFIFGIMGKTSEHMLRYLEAKGLRDDLEGVWSPQLNLNILPLSQVFNFDYDVYHATAVRFPKNLTLSKQKIRLKYQSGVALTGLRLELKYENSQVPAVVLNFNLPATGTGGDTFTLDLPADFMLWNIREMTLLFPQSAGRPLDALDEIWIQAV